MDSSEGTLPVHGEVLVAQNNTFTSGEMPLHEVDVADGQKQEMLLDEEEKPVDQDMETEQNEEPPDKEVPAIDQDMPAGLEQEALELKDEPLEHSEALLDKKEDQHIVPFDQNMKPVDSEDPPRLQDEPLEHEIATPTEARGPPLDEKEDGVSSESHQMGLPPESLEQAVVPLPDDQQKMLLDEEETPVDQDTEMEQNEEPPDKEVPATDQNISAGLEQEALELKDEPLKHNEVSLDAKAVSLNEKEDQHVVPFGQEMKREDSEEPPRGQEEEPEHKVATPTQESGPPLDEKEDEASSETHHMGLPPEPLVQTITLTAQEEDVASRKEDAPSDGNEESHCQEEEPINEPEVPSGQEEEPLEHKITTAMHADGSQLDEEEGEASSEPHCMGLPPEPLKQAVVPSIEEMLPKCEPPPNQDEVSPTKEDVPSDQDEASLCQEEELCNQSEAKDVDEMVLKLEEMPMDENDVAHDAPLDEEDEEVQHKPPPPKNEASPLRFDGFSSDEDSIPLKEPTKVVFQWKAMPEEQQAGPYESEESSSDEEDVPLGKEKDSPHIKYKPPSKPKEAPLTVDDGSSDDDVPLASFIPGAGGHSMDQEHDEIDVLMENIFGEDLGDLDANPSQEDQTGDDKLVRKNKTKKRSRKISEVAEPKKKRKRSKVAEGEEENQIEWDFDRMMNEKKKERRARRSHGRGDFINDFDPECAALVEEMKAAAKADRASNMERRPAVRKRIMLERVRERLRNVDLIEAHIENGMLVAISEWLAPLPDKSLPALEVRRDILKLLPSFGRIGQEALKQSGLGKAVMLLFKHPKETRINKKMAESLITDWARPIFQLDVELSREERAELDLQRFNKYRKKATKIEEPVKPPPLDYFQAPPPGPRPGDPDFVYRAKAPMPSTKEYVNRPTSKVETPFHSESKRKATGWNRAMKEVKKRVRANAANPVRASASRSSTS